MKAIMYHYVRDDDSTLSHLRYLHVEDFRKQLDYFMQNFGVVSKASFLEALEGGPLPDGVVLTFDDGFVDHHRFVLPELERRGLWGIFYIPTGPLQDKRLLDVHRVHLLLGRFGGEQVAEVLKDMLDTTMLRHDRRDEFERTTYLRQKNTVPELFVKRVLNYFVNPDCRSLLTGMLMDHFFAVRESEILSGIYMNDGQIKDLAEAGMMIGSHTVNHPVMSSIAAEKQEWEIFTSFATLERIVGTLNPRTFCYPYGGVSTFTEETERLLHNHDVAFSFAVEPRDMTLQDLRHRPQALPRYDCNQFPHGQCRTLS